MSTYAQSERTQFLGTLTSDVADESLLPAGFQVLRLRFDELWDLYVDQQITRDQFAEQLRGMRVVGADGFEWTIGATTRRWHRRSVDGSWIIAPPPPAATEEAGTAPAMIRVADPADSSSHDSVEEPGEEAANLASGNLSSPAEQSVTEQSVTEQSVTEQSVTEQAAAESMATPECAEAPMPDGEPTRGPAALPEPMPYSGPVVFDEDEESPDEQPRYGGLPDNRAPDRFSRFATPTDQPTPSSD